MKFILLLLTSVFSVNVSAEVYKCTDASGNKVYRSSPCEGGYNNKQIDLTTGATVDLDEEAKLQALRLKEQQEQFEQKKLEKQQEDLRKLKILNEIKEASKKNQMLMKDNPGKFSAYAIPPYDPENLPPLVKRYESKLAKIEGFRGAAAVKALASGECERVESSELNEKSTNDLLVFLVDCSDPKAFYFDEKQLAK